MHRCVALTLFWLAAGFPAWAQSPSLQHIQVGRLDRTYLIERFHAEQAQGRLPIVVFLHGLGTLVTEGVLPRFDIDFTAVKGLPPALILRPQGVDRRWDSLPGWIDSWQRLSGTEGEPVDDIAFLRALIDHVVAEENGDPTRVYVAGVSSGGYFVPRIVCEMGDKVAAVADVIATSRQVVFERCPAPPVPFVLIASTTDDTNPYAGQRGDRQSRLASAPDAASFFAKHNGCTTRTETPLPHRDPALDSTVSLIRFSGCADGADVLFYRVDGSFHSVPSTDPIGQEGWAASGRRNRDMDTATELWAFFSAHQRVSAAASPRSGP